ncbi:MAG: PTS sugar transporter subunit IIA [Verrucomicrobiae bacterium]|nr:PTS sugar transporter subunit IIA [Verrucomicrobiae bacterium]MCP5521343.1 PTS sugar transporter subunit IIA [Verrucomicrobiales bacterium]
MQLTVKNVANLLSVSEKSVYRWIGERGLPAHRVGGQLRLTRGEVIGWATANKINLVPQVFEEPEADGRPPALSEAIEAGGVFYRISGSDVASVLAGVVDYLRLPEGADRALLLQMLLAREQMASTAVGEGVAIPHARNPVVLHVDKPIVTLCFLEHPVDFGALDGLPVQVLFTLVSPTVRAHLHLLSRLSFALRDTEFKQQLREQASRDVLIATLRRLSAGLSASGAVQPVHE